MSSESAATRLSWADALPLWLFTTWAVLLVVRIHWPYIEQPSEQSVDEGYLVAIGQLMLHGRMLPFVDGVAHTGPIFLFSGALIAVFGEFSWLPTRVAAMIAFAATAGLAFACGRRAGRPLAGAIAAAAVPFYASLRMVAYDGIAYNAELPALVFALSSLYACVRALGDAERPISRTWLIAAGLLASCCALSKQVAVLLVAPHALYVLVALLTRGDLTPRRRVRLLAAYAAAGVLLPLLLAARLWAAGGLSDAYYYLVTYNHRSYMQPFREVSRWSVYGDWLAARPLELALSLGSLAWAVSRLIAARAVEPSWLRALARSRFDLTLALMAMGGMIGARASLREFDHYYLMMIPGFGLLVGCLVERAVAGDGPTARGLIGVQRAVLLAPLVLTGEVAWARKATHLTAWSTQHMHVTDLAAAHEEPPACEFIRKHSTPNDRLFVWGFRPQLYVSCGRLPATRFVFTTFVSGYVPNSDYPKETEDRLAVPGARDLLIRDLESTKPPVIVDAARTMAFRSFRRYEELLAYVEQHYRLAGVVGGDEVWVRRGPDQARRP